MTIYIPFTNIWAKSRKRVLEFLGNYHSENNPNIVLNFGGNRLLSRNQKILNSRINHLRDKVEMNKVLDCLNIRHPKTFYFPFLNLPRSNDECVIKPRFGQRGKNITFTNFNTIPSIYITPNYYIQYYIPFEKEYRIGIDFKRILGIREKTLIEGNSRIKNSRTCTYRTIKNNKRLEKFALKIFKKFEIDFCGIDIGECNNKYYVIEINSAPTVGEVWAKKLANDLKDLLNNIRR